jgi:hypothetical protein
MRYSQKIKTEIEVKNTKPAEELQNNHAKMRTNNKPKSPRPVGRAGTPPTKLLKNQINHPKNH